VCYSVLQCVAVCNAAEQCSTTHLSEMQKRNEMHKHEMHKDEMHKHEMHKHEMHKHEMQCNTLSLTAATHCSTIQHTAHLATHNVLGAKDAFLDTLQHTATHCNTLQHTATFCSTLQHTATHNILSAKDAFLDSHTLVVHFIGASCLRHQTFVRYITHLMCCSVCCNVRCSAWCV